MSACVEKERTVECPAVLLSCSDPDPLSSAQSSQLPSLPVPRPLCAGSIQNLGLGCEVAEGDGLKDVGRGWDIQWDSNLVCLSDSGQQRLMAKNINSGIRLVETEILTQFSNWLFYSISYLKCLYSEFQRVMGLNISMNLYSTLCIWMTLWHIACAMADSQWLENLYLGSCNNCWRRWWRFHWHTSEMR